MGTTKEYLQELYRQSSEQTQNNLGTKGAFVILAFKMGFAAVGIALLVALKLLPSSDPIYKTVLGIFTSDIIGFVAMWFISPIVSICNVPKIAAINDRKQRERLEEVDPDLAKIIVTGVPTGDMGIFYRKGVGVDIKNTTSEDFDCIFELIELSEYFVNAHCDEYQSDHPIDISNSHFPVPKIKGNDHAVVKFAELRDSIGDGKGAGIVLLTEKPIPLILIEMLFVSPELQLKPDYAKMYVSIEFEIKGKLGDKFLSQKYSTLITLRSEVLSKINNNSVGMKLGSRNIETTIEIGEVTREY